MKTLQEIKDFELSSEDRSTLNNFKGSKEYECEKRVIENYILKLTANLLTGTEIEPGTSTEELKALRGFIRFWSKFKKVIENNES